MTSEGDVLDRMDKTIARAISSRGNNPCFHRGNVCTTVRAAKVVDGDIVQMSAWLGETAAFSGTAAN